MPEKWIHLCETGGDPWVIPIWSSIHKAQQADASLDMPAAVSEVAVHISTRLTMLPRVVKRLNGHLAALYGEVKKYEPSHIFSKDTEGAALRVNDDVKYSVIADVDLFLFEVNACAELMQEYFALLHAVFADEIPAKERTQRLKAALKGYDVPAEWFRKLDKARNFAAHNGTPYIAIDMSQPGKPEAVFLMENLKLLNDPDKFFTTSDLQEIGDGFATAKKALQRHLVEWCEQKQRI